MPWHRNNTERAASTAMQAPSTTATAGAGAAAAGPPAPPGQTAAGPFGPRPPIAAWRLQLDFFGVAASGLMQVRCRLHSRNEGPSSSAAWNVPSCVPCVHIWVPRRLAVDVPVAAEGQRNEGRELPPGSHPGLPPGELTWMQSDTCGMVRGSLYGVLVACPSRQCARCYMLGQHHILIPFSSALPRRRWLSSWWASSPHCTRGTGGHAWRTLGCTHGLCT